MISKKRVAKGEKKCSHKRGRPNHGKVIVSCACQNLLGSACDTGEGRGGPNVKGQRGEA